MLVPLAMTAVQQGPARADDTAPIFPEPTQVVEAAAVGKGMCLGYNGLDRYNPPEQVKAGRFRTPDEPAVRVARGANVNWKLNPYRDRTWQLWLHSLEWLGGLIRDYERNGDGASLRLAAGITQDWLKDNPSPAHFSEDRRDAVSAGTKFRLITMVCLRAHYKANWLEKAIAAHARWLAEPEHYSGPWNHGTDESMTLMTAGCAIRRSDLAGIGYKRLVNSILRPPKGTRPAIDSQGADNEQSTMYSIYNRSRWRLAFEAMRTCDRKVPAEMRRRWSLMDEFIAFQTTPAGDLLQIGESFAAKASGIGAPGNGPLRYVITGGTAGTRPSARVRVYSAGYLMGRSGWGQSRPYASEMAYTARFGPRRYAHGQNDHMAVTFHAQGRDILVPSGHIGYSDPTWRSWLRSPSAHNTLVVKGARYREVSTKLTARRFQAGADFFRFSDTAFTGTTRSRSVLAASGPDALVVLDQTRSGTSRTVEQLWHLPAAFKATARGSGAVATAGTVRVHFVRVALSGGTRLSPKVVRGARKPLQGWIVPAQRKTVRAPAVVLPVRGSRTRTLTLILPVQGDQAPRVRTRPIPGGALRVEATISGRRLIVKVAADGTLSRLSR